MTRIAVVSIPVADQQRSKTFYSEVMGFKLIREEPMGPGQSWIQFAPSEGSATITLVSWFEDMSPGCLQGLVLQTDDVRRDYEALQLRGLKLSGLETAPWGTYATFDDPDGNGWVLQQMTPKSAAGGLG